MYSKIVPFQDIIQAVKDETGSSNLRNLYPHISRLIYRIERDIGFGYGLLMKRVTYSKEDGTIFEQKIRLPKDLLIIESIGTAELGLNTKDYHHQGNYLFLCSDEIDEFDLIYYTMLCDGEGFPTITENHFDAVVAGIKFYLYQPKVWNNEGSAQMMKYYQDYYFDRVGEAIGNDVMPSTELEWAQIAQHLRMSYRDILIYSEEKQYTCVQSGTNNEVLTTNENPDEIFVYDWQYAETDSDISDAPDINQAFLDLKNKSNLSVFTTGIVIPYTEIGRVALAIQNIEVNTYRIKDIFGADITDVVFDTYYNITMKTQIYISKNVFSFGNIFYKITKV